VVNVLCGICAPTKGTIRVNGLDLIEEMDAIHSIMGVCPQHDILWADQTGREHLLFYGRLKGLSGNALATAVSDSLRLVNLSALANMQTRAYSGGMRRRLSVAIALIGNPRVVSLDEPTTGLDPHSRREVWDAILKCKRDRAVILTTHSMEEADALCDRIGILSHGRLKCIGYGPDLKLRYGAGYRLMVTTKEEAFIRRIEDFVVAVFPRVQHVETLGGMAEFLVPPDGMMPMSQIYDAFARKEAELHIADWGLQAGSLEDVFVKLTAEDDRVPPPPFSARSDSSFPP